MFFSVIVAVTFAKVRILDTPGFADTRGPRGPQHNELDKKSIATHIQEHIATVNAVLILANGTARRITVGTEHALSTFLPKTLASNVAFLFTNVPVPLSFYLCEDALPALLKDAPRFLFDSPIARQRLFLELTNDPINKEARREWREWRETVKEAEQKGLGLLVNLFDWLDGCEPQPTTEIVALYETSQAIETKITNTLAQMDQAEAMIAKINKSVKAAQTNFVSPLRIRIWRSYVCQT